MREQKRVISRNDIDLVWSLIQASERVGYISATLHDKDTIAEFSDAFAERQKLFGEVLKRLEGTDE
jgi:hypothetical protein